MTAITADMFMQWNRQLAEIATGDDPARIPEQLMLAITRLVDVDQHAILLFGPDRKPTVLVEWAIDSWPTEDFISYNSSAYLLDPYYRAGIEGIEAGLYRIRDVAPPAFHASEYYKTYYKNSPIEDELGFITYLTDGCFANLALNRTTSSEPFSDAERERLAAALPLVESLMLRYWERVGSNATERGSELYVQLEQALKVFGTSVLTPREAEVMRMYLYGHDTRSISERLDISAHTVSAHRKHLYARLDINSQAELFSLFINSMYSFDGDPTRDPLDRYLHPPRD